MCVPAACGSSDDSANKSGGPTQASTSASRPATVSVPPQLRGEFRRLITDADYRRVHVPPDEDRPPPKCVWHLTFTPEWVRFMACDGGSVTEEWKPLPGHRLQLGDYAEGTQSKFCDRPRPAIYAWHATSGRLVLTPKQDSCEDPRPDRLLVAAGTWRQ